MKRTLVMTVLMAVAVTTVVAAPVESVESGRAAALAKVEGVLAEKVVADRLLALGLTREQVSARLAKLSDAQLQQLAAHVEQIRAGGDIQGDTSDGWIFGAILKQLGEFFYNIFQVLFFWRDQR